MRIKMIEYLQEYTATEQDNIKKTIQDLFRQTCILQVKYDPVTLIARDNPRYQVCARHREFISNYLSVLDCELIHDPQEHIFRIAGEGIVLEKLNLITTKLFIILKLIYREKIMGAGLQATVTNLAEIREYGANTNLITRKMNAQELGDSLQLLKTHQIIEIPGAISNVEDDTPIYIYSTIQIFLSSADIGELVKTYQDEIEELLQAEDSKNR